ncbi:MAG: hypothetical protein LBT14_07230 [Treponema sp.]|jgi:hypothetical protein|nr:hypothetical protein [Treponema sp.]
MIRFIAEIGFRGDVLIQATPSNSYSRVNNIYEIDMSPPPASSYWLDWGGVYDEYVGTQIELYFGQFLQHVNTQAELLLTPYSLFISDTMVYFNIPKHPWLYADYEAEMEDVIQFLSSSLDPDNPSRNELRSDTVETRLEVPSFTVKLSDNISGITLNQGFSITLANDDGYFDDDDEWDLFNTPVRVKKSTVENPVYQDFLEIRGGLAGSTNTSFDKFTIDVQDKMRNMEESVCTLIQQADFPDITLEDDAIGKSIPVIYGQKKVKPIPLDGINKYLCAEKTSSISSVVDKDGNTLSYTSSTQGDYTVITITSTKPDSDPVEYLKPDTAVITGYTANKIGEILKDLVSKKTLIQYHNSNWNTAEVAAYIAISPRVNIVFTGGNVKKAIDDTLKSDMAYFIQQADGRFTIRRYGRNYSIRSIPTWSITKKPDKDFDKAHENYFSSCLIKYNFTETDRNTFSEYYFSDMEADAEDRYRKKLVKEYETDLISKTDAKALAQLLGTRYTIMRQRLKIATGIDTSRFELLDKVTIDVTINGRKFSKASNFIITEINLAQDILTLEEV